MVKKDDNGGQQSHDNQVYTRPRDLKANQKLTEAREKIWLNELDERAFEKTVDEVKWRYYEVAQALLKHRGVKKHKLLEANKTLR